MTKEYSRPYSVRPSAELATMLAAIDEWLHYEQENDNGDLPPRMTTFDAVVRGLPYGDATCDNGCSITNYPHRLQRGRTGGWLARYRCRSCGRSYTCTWSDYRMLADLGV